MNYNETTIANKLTSNNINIRTGNNLNSVSTIINDTTIDTVDTLMNLNNIKLDIGNGIGIAVAEEKHEHEHIHDTWGGDIGRAALGGAITGLASGIGIKGGEFLGKLASGSIGNLVEQTTSKVVGSMVNASITSYSTSIGSAMANTTIYGGSFKDVMKSGWKSAGDKDTWKSVGISAGIAGAGTLVGEYISKVKADYNASLTEEQKLLNMEPVSEGSSNLKMGNWSDNKVGINSYIDKEGNIIKAGTTNEIVSKYASNQSELFKTFNLLPGSPSFADFHDALNLPGIWNQLSIPPAYITSQFSAIAPYTPYIIQYENSKKDKKNYDYLLDIKGIDKIGSEK